MKHIKVLLILSLMVFLLVGLTTFSATDINKTDSTSKTGEVAKTGTACKDTNTIEKASITKTDTNNKTIETTKDLIPSQEKSVTKKNSTKSVKTSSITYNIASTDSDDHVTLNSYMTSSGYDEITINIHRNLRVQGPDRKINSKVKTLTINGNGYQIGTYGKLNGNEFINVTHNCKIILNNLRLTDFYHISGAVIYSKGATIELNNCVFEDNQATVTHGGVIDATRSTIRINNCIFRNNTAEYIGNGGAIYIYNDKSGNTVVINNSKFIENSAEKSGGAIFYEGTSDFTIYNCEFVENEGVSGGAVYGTGSLRMEYCNFTQNSASNMGGAIFHASDSLIALDCNFINNTAQFGGAIRNDFGRTTVSMSNYIENKARVGGAISCNGEIALWYSELTKNYAEDNGGAVHVEEGKLTSIDCNFTYNEADGYGGAISAKITDMYSSISRSTFKFNYPNNFFIEDKHIKFGNSDGFIDNIRNISIFMNDTEVFHCNNVNELINFEIKDNTNVEMMITSRYISSSIFVLRNFMEVNVTNYQELMDCMEETKNEYYDRLTINLLPGNYAAIGNITWNNARTRDVIIQGNGNTLDGQGEYQFMYIAKEHSLMLNNITITNYTSSDGGAINNNGSLNITNVNINDNTATGNGGVIYNNGSLNITNVNINDNTATGYGGAIYNDGTLKIYNATITNNTAESGGAIYNGGGSLSITYSSLNNNTANVYGGAIANWGKETSESSIYGFVSIAYSNLTYNTAGNQGGATLNYMGNLNITNSNLQYNKAKNSGGAIGAMFDNNVTIRDSNLNYNTVTNGSGGAVYSNRGTLNIINSNLFRNMARRNGAITVVQGEFKMRNCTVFLNDGRYQEGPVNNRNGTSNVFNTTYYDNFPSKFYIEDNHIINSNLDNLTNFTNYQVIVDNEIVLEGNQPDDMYMYTIQNNASNVQIILDPEIQDIVFILKNTKERKVTCYAELINALEETKYERYTHYQIDLEPGNYTATANITLNDSFTRNIVINGNGNTLDGQNKYQFMNLYGGSSLTLNNMKITNYVASQGGAIFSGGNLNITNVTFTRNTATTMGGAIYSEGNISLTNVTFILNNANTTGGAIHTEGNLIITNATFTRNTATTMGGAIYCRGSINISNSTFTGNTATARGGAIYIQDGTYKSTNTTFFGNNPANFEIPSKYIRITEDDSFIGNIVDYIIQVDNIGYHGTDPIYILFLEIPAEAKYVEITYDTNSITRDVYVLRYSKERNITSYQELIDAFEEAKDKRYSSYIINLNPGNYTATSNITWDYSLTQNIIINGNGNTLDGQNKYQFIKIMANNNLNIENITITNYSAENGGVIQNEQGNVNINNATLTNNKADYGGAIFNSGNLNIKNSKLTKNNGNTSGGAIENNKGTLIITNSLLEDNNAENGGAITNNNSGTILVYDCIFNNNQAENSGSAIHNYATANITGNNFITNTVNHNGSVIYDAHQTATITDNINADTSKYNLTISTYSPNNDVWITDNIFHDKINTSITISTNNTSPTIKDEICITFILEDQVGLKLSEILNITINNEKYSVTTDNNGIATINYTIKLNETYINATYYGNEKYIQNTTLFDITAEKLDTKILIDDVNALVGRECTITGTLIDTKYNTPITGAKINITINDKTEELTTNEYGQFNMTMIPDEKREYPISVTYYGDESYKQSTNNTAKITTNKINTKITLTVSNATPVNDTEITVTATLLDVDDLKLVNQDVTLNIDDEFYSMKTDENGQVTQTYRPTTVGTHSIKAIYYGDSHYVNSSAVTSIVVGKYDTKIMLVVSNATPVNDTEITVTATLLDEDDLKLVNQDVTLNIDGEFYSMKTDADGKVVQVYTPRTLGIQEIMAWFDGDSHYVNSSAVTSIVVGKYDTKIMLVVSNATPVNDTEITVTATLLDEDNLKLVNQDVTLNINGEFYSMKTDANGQVTQTYRPTAVGMQSIKAVYDGDSRYVNSSASMDITVSKINTKLTLNVSNSTPQVMGTITIVTTLTDINNNKLANQSITLITADGSKTLKTDANGQVTQTYRPTAVGMQSIKATYDGNITYNPATQNTQITVTKLPTTTTIRVTNNIAGNVTVTGTVKDKNGNNVNEGTVTLNYGQTTVGSTDVKNGQYNIITSITNKGKYTLQARYSGTETYLPSSNQTTVNVETKTVTMDAKITGDGVGKTNVTVSVKDSDGKGVSGIPIIVTLSNGTTIQATTDNNGTANIPVDLREGNSNITVTYPGNGTYNPITQKFNKTVSKNNPIIKLNPVKGVIGEKITLTAYLTDADGTPITGGNLAFKLNGKTLRSDGRFDSKAPAMKFAVKDGYVNYTINADLYLRNAKNLTVAYSGNYKYKEMNSESVEAQIQKRYANITVTVTPNVTRQYETITIKVTAKDTTKNGKNTTLITDNTKVMLKINGVTLKDAKGKALYVPIQKDKTATYTYTIAGDMGGVSSTGKVRNYPVTAIFVGDNYYPGAKNVTTFQVQRSATYVNITQALVTKTNVLSVKATLKDYKGNYLKGTNKVTIKINGKNYVDPKNGKAKYWSVKNGVVNLTGIQVDPKTTIKRVMLVTGERQAYTEGRAEITNILKT